MSSVSQPLRHSLYQFPRAFWVLVGATFVTRFGVFVFPFLTLFLTRRGFTATDAGLAVGAYSAGGFGAAIVGGWMADRLGRNVTMALASLVGAACMLAFSQAESFPWLIALALLTGFISEAGNPASSALVQDLIPAEHRVNAYAVLRMAINLGWSAGPAAAGFLAAHSFFWLFIGDAGTSAFFGFVALFCLPKGRPTPKHESGWGFALRDMMTNRGFLALAASQVFLAMTFRQLNTTYTLHFDRCGHDLVTLGLLQSLNGVIIVACELALLAATRAWPLRYSMGLGYFIMGACYLLFFFGNTVVIFAAIMVVFTIGEMMAFSRQSAYLSELAPDNMRGRYGGFMSFSWCIGSSSSSVLGLPLYEACPNAVWVLCAALGLASFGCLLVKPNRATASGVERRL